MATEKQAKNVHTLSTLQWCWCSILSLGKRLSTKAGKGRPGIVTRWSEWAKCFGYMSLKSPRNLHPMTIPHLHVTSHRRCRLLGRPTRSALPPDHCHTLTPSVARTQWSFLLVATDTPLQIIYCEFWGNTVLPLLSWVTIAKNWWEQRF